MTVTVYSLRQHISEIKGVYESRLCEVVKAKLNLVKISKITKIKSKLQE